MIITIIIVISTNKKKFQYREKTYMVKVGSWYSIQYWWYGGDGSVGGGEGSPIF